MEKSLIHSVVMFPTGNQSSVVSKPGNGALDLPTVFVTPKCPAILGWGFVPIAPVGRNKLNALFFKFLTKLIRIIRFIPNQPLRLFTQLVNRLIDNLYLMWTVRGKGHCQRNTLAISHHHELRPLATLGFPDFWAPFFADTKLPSIKHSAQLIWPFLSSSWMRVCQSFSQISCSSHLFNRLQHVLGLGYFSGRSFHLAPVRRIQRMPSTTKRLFFQGRPLLFNFGSKGSIFFHCLSLRYIARLIGLFPPMNLLSANYL